MDLLDQATVDKPGGNGSNQYRTLESETANSDIVTNSRDEPERGNGSQYALRKLRKDAPDIHAPSVNAS